MTGINKVKTSNRHPKLQKEIETKNILRITREKEKIDKELKILKSGSLEQQKKLARGILTDWGISAAEKNPKDLDEIILWVFSIGVGENKGGNRKDGLYQKKVAVKKRNTLRKDAIAIMKDSILQGLENLKLFTRVSIVKESVLQKIKRYIKE